MFGAPPSRATTSTYTYLTKSGEVKELSGDVQDPIMGPLCNGVSAAFQLGSVNSELITEDPAKTSKVSQFDPIILDQMKFLNLGSD